LDVANVTADQQLMLLLKGRKAAGDPQDRSRTAVKPVEAGDIVDISGGESE
jgi:hypothetical protein